MAEEKKGNSNALSADAENLFDSDDFFDSLEGSVNGIVSDGEALQARHKYLFILL